MRRLFPVLFLAAAGLLAMPATAAAQCEADGDIEFVCGPVSPEDLIQIPDSPWVIVASMVDDGYLSAADSRDSSTVRLFPTTTTPSRGAPRHGPLRRVPGHDHRAVPGARRQHPAG